MKITNFTQKLKEAGGLYLGDWKTSALEFAALFEGVYALLYWDLKPAIMIAGIPIFNATDIDCASSDEVLKYRSIGGIFMAHQKGGTQTLKIGGTIIGPSRYFFLKILLALQRLNLGKQKPAEDLTYDSGRKILKSIISPKLFLDASQKVYRSEVDTYEYHKTFPIITPDRLYTKMYIETIEYVESTNIGQDTIKYNIALRRFSKPTHHTYRDKLGKKRDPEQKEFAVYTDPKKKNLDNYLWYLYNFILIGANIANELRFTNSEFDIQMRYLKDVGTTAASFIYDLVKPFTTTNIFSEAVSSIGIPVGGVV